jgi:hypothetical protein
MTLSFPFLGDIVVAVGSTMSAITDRAEATDGLLEIVRPSAIEPTSDGNLTLIEIGVAEALRGGTTRVDIAIDDGSWVSAERAAANSAEWRHLWSDTLPGSHRVKVRAVNAAGEALAERANTIEVRDLWTGTYIIDNPYAVPGPFRKGQLHVHSKASFDGSTSLAPTELALAYKARGYEVVAITDHDVVAHAQSVNGENFITIPAYESTADRGHISGLFTDQVVSPGAAPQERIDAILGAGGLAILNHPNWHIGWSASDFNQLRGYRAIEIFNGITTAPGMGVSTNLASWQAVLNSRGWLDRVWAVAVDDAHRPEELDQGWVQIKTAHLSLEAVREALTRGSFYASNGPSFSTLGVMNGTITAASPEATVLRFYGQDGQLLQETPPTWGAYQPTGKERWIRVEALMADGRAAWSQPFWLLPNAPRVKILSGASGLALQGTTLPEARVYLTDRGRYLGSILADSEGIFTYNAPDLSEGAHEMWVLATASWPDQLESRPTVLTWGTDN